MNLALLFLIPSLLHQPDPVMTKWWGVMSREETQNHRWEKPIDELQADTDEEKLYQVNYYWNHHVTYMTDQDQFGIIDVWSTPAETYKTGKGDCEDYAIAKYYSLKHLGFSVDRMDIVTGILIKRNEIHTVLVVDGMVLSNIDDEIIPASEDDTFQPIFSLNETGYKTMEK